MLANRHGSIGRWALASLLAGVVLAGGAVPLVYAQGPGPAISAADVEAAGFSTERLARLTAALKTDIDAGVIPGAYLRIERKGRIVYDEALGALDPEAKTAMRKDGIFRIYSMTKPITSVAAMMLVEEGRLALTDPVAKFIPEFAAVKVGVEKAGADGKPVLELVPSRRPMTVQDLLRHTSGLTYGFYGTGLVKDAYRASQGIFGQDLDNAAFSKALATLPLMHQPGTNWEYSQSTDVLGRVVEVAAGQTLFQVMKARILDPLGMGDTSFFVADSSKFARIVEPFAADRNFGIGADVSDPRKPIKYESGGGGMVSTMADYARFVRMLVGGGAAGSVRLLSPTTLRLMTSDHIAGLGLGSAYLPGDGYGFGLGFQVRRADGMSPQPGTTGDYSWGGAAGTAFWVDPAQEMFVILMMQAPKQRTIMRMKVRQMVYAAIVK